MRQNLGKVQTMMSTSPNRGCYLVGKNGDGEHSRQSRSMDIDIGLKNREATNLKLSKTVGWHIQF